MGRDGDENGKIQWKSADEIFIDLDFPNCAKYCGRQCGKF